MGLLTIKVDAVFRVARPIRRSDVRYVLTWSSFIVSETMPKCVIWIRVCGRIGVIGCSI